MEQNYDELLTSELEKLKHKLSTMLGANLVDVELEDADYDIAIENAIDNLRSWSSNTREEAFLYLMLQRTETVYTLPDNIEIVNKVLRRGNGLVGGGATVDPFSLAYANTYMLSASRTNSGGNLLSYDLYHQFDNTVSRLFGRDMNFQFNPVSKRLTIERDIRSDEEVVLFVNQNLPDYFLLKNQQMKIWIRDWALTEVKIILGRARSKISSMPGPQGSWSLDGSALIGEAMKDQEALKMRLRKYEDGSMPLGIIRG